MKPLLVGLQNPLSDDPRYALYPEPTGSTGWRIAEMLRPAFSHRDYLALFDRTNLLDRTAQIGGPGYTARLRRGADRLNDLIVSHGHELVVLFGGDVWRAVLGLPKVRPPWLSWQWGTIVPPVRFLTLPHPSGRNRWYSDAENSAAAARALRQLGLAPFVEAARLLCDRRLDNLAKRGT